MIEEAIILVGGLGTRLRSIVNDIPKPMADINGKPFLYYLISYFKNHGIKSIILSVGYKSEIIINYFGNESQGVNIVYSIEKVPLGTGGAILKAMKLVNGKDVIVTNGDTLFNIDMQSMIRSYFRKDAKMIFALKEMENNDRYGTVITNDDDKITGFKEKKYFQKGFINGGVYIIDKRYFLNLLLSEKFSFEQFIEGKVEELLIFSYHSNAYFIDIGIPQDYYKAIKELPKLISKAQ